MAPSPTIRRLLKETAELSSAAPNPTPAFHAAPVSDEDLHEWHFTLVGPPAPSPYAGGLYHGRITLPPQYPLKPPNFRFLTPSGRFEVNREICLSISGFHEETWMPAWGVRTALTALRTFMAEPGTAGQVGGLEAPDYVRKRLAGESRAWRCGGCAEGKTNEEIMREWWEVCRQKGVKVDEEGNGEGVGLEVLPEGMAVEAREVGKGKAAEQESIPQTGTVSSQQTHIDSVQQPPVSSPSSIQQPQQHPQAPTSQPPPPHPSIPQQPLAAPPQQPIPSDAQSQSQPQAQPLPQAQQHSAYFSPTPTPEQAQRHAESHLTPSDTLTRTTTTTNTTEQRAQRPMLNLHAPPLAAASAALAEHAALLSVAERQRLQQQGGLSAGQVGMQQGAGTEREQQQPATVTIDRAIAGVFLMLVVMVLKKIFYPGGIIAEGGGGMFEGGQGQGGGLLEREL